MTWMLWLVRLFLLAFRIFSLSLLVIYLESFSAFHHLYAN